ncbi:MAG: peptide ABC transporter substrate-binding protein [Phenylobacterium sp.]
MKLPVLLVMACSLAIAACQPQVSRPPCPPGKTCLAWGNNTEAGSLDPQKASMVDEFAIIGDLYTGLFTDGPDASPSPALAQSWTTSADGLTWTFRLRPSKWTDGRPVTADDFVYAYRRILDPATASSYAYLLYLLENGEAVNEGRASPETLGVRAIDPLTLQFRLEHPAPYLPALLKHHSFFPVPAHAVKAHGDAWTRAGNFVGNGAFRLVDWKLGERIRVIKNPDFYDAASVCVDQIDYFPTPDSVMAERRVARGELDLNTNFQSSRVQRLRDTLPGYVRTYPALATSYIALNTVSVPAFRDIRVRRALSMGVDRDFITAKLMRAGQKPAYSFVPPATAGHVEGVRLQWADMPFEARQAEARRLLAEAGYGPQRPLEVEIKVGNSPDNLLLSQAVAADWTALGLKVTTVQNEGQIAFAAYKRKDFQVGMMSWYADFNDPLTFLGLFRSDTGQQNYSGYANPRYDALLDQADLEPDAGRRSRLLAQAEQLMLDEEGVIPVFQVVSRALVSPRVTGWTDNVENFHRARWVCVKPAAAG